MNIGIDVRCLMDKQRTGVGEYTYGLLDAIFKIDKGNRYFLFYNSYKDVSEVLPKWDYPNVSYVWTRWPNKIFIVFLLFGLVKLDNLVIKNLDVWFAPNLNFASLTSKVKFILTVHDLSFEFLPDCYTLKQRLRHKLLRPKKQCKRAEVILTPSESTKRDVVAWYSVVEKKVLILRPGLSATTMQNADNRMQVREKYNLPEKFILFLGTIEPRKNVEAVVVAYKETCKLANLQTCKLVIAGAKGWKNKEIFEMIANTPNVRYIDYVAEEDKPALYQMASLFVYPSLYEGFGLPVLEAMACGTPVITSNRSSLPEVGGDAVCYVNPANVAELAEAMERMLQDDELRIMNYELRVERQREQVKRFDWNKSAEEFLSLVNI